MIGLFARVVAGALVFGGCTGLAVGQLLEMNERVFEAVQKKYDRRARRQVEAWYKLMVEQQSDPALSDKKKTRAANDFFNRVPWVSDQKHWGKEDYWATPIEMLGTNGGDCEDFSIAKYFTLSETGVELEKLRITYVKALDYNQAHMVLAYYPTPEAEPWILDNIKKTIMPASGRSDLLPVYSFNGDGLWLAKARDRKLTSDAGASLPQWAEMKRRMFEELTQN